jgi:phenylacetate-CoA ligase
MLRTPDGRIVPGEFFPHLMKEVAAIGSFQVRQKRLDRLEILMVPRGELRDADEAFLRREIAKVFGASIEIAIERVQDIPLTPTGKRRVTVSELPATLP